MVSKQPGVLFLEALFKRIRQANEGKWSVVQMSEQAKSVTTAKPVFILAGNSTQYSAARQQLGLTPSQASWLTRPMNLAGKSHPKVFRFGDWKSLPNLREIEEAMATAEAEVTDLS